MSRKRSGVEAAADDYAVERQRAEKALQTRDEPGVAIDPDRDLAVVRLPKPSDDGEQVMGVTFEIKEGRDGKYGVTATPGVVTPVSPVPIMDYIRWLREKPKSWLRERIKAVTKEEATGNAHPALVAYLASAVQLARAEDAAAVVLSNTDEEEVRREQEYKVTTCKMRLLWTKYLANLLITDEEYQVLSLEKLPPSAEALGRVAGLKKRTLAYRKEHGAMAEEVLDKELEEKRQAAAGTSAAKKPAAKKRTPSTTKKEKAVKTKETTKETKKESAKERKGQDELIKLTRNFKPGMKVRYTGKNPKVFGKTVEVVRAFPPGKVGVVIKTAEGVMNCSPANLMIKK